MSNTSKYSIRRQLDERPGHFVGIVRSVDPPGILMVCTCSHEDVWRPHESPNVVARRWNAHLAPKPVKPKPEKKPRTRARKRKEQP